MSKNKYMTYHNIYSLDEDSVIHKVKANLKPEDKYLALSADEINVNNTRSLPVIVLLLFS
jgi:hypothetical protein